MDGLGACTIGGVVGHIIGLLLDPLVSTGHKGDDFGAVVFVCDDRKPQSPRFDVVGVMTSQTTGFVTNDVKVVVSALERASFVDTTTLSVVLFGVALLSEDTEDGETAGQELFPVVIEGDFRDTLR